MIFVTLIFVCNNLFAAIRNVPIQYSTIQTALDACTTGDTVLVQPGNYFENIYWPDVAGIKLFSAGDSGNTVIDGGNLDAVIYFDGDNINIYIDSTTVIKGFRITGGGCNSGVYCGGIFLYNNCNPKITEVSITENYSTLEGGGGICAVESSFILSNSSVYFNFNINPSYCAGAGIFSTDGNPVIRNVNVSENILGDSASWYYGSGIAILGGSYIRLENVSIHDNSMGSGGSFQSFGGGLYIDGQYSVQLNNVDVYSNRMGSDVTYQNGGGIFVTADSIVNLFDVKVYNNIMGDDGSYYTGGGVILGASHLFLENVVVYNNIMGNGGSYYWGAGVSMGGGNANFKNVLIASNQAGTPAFAFPYLQGGGIRLAPGTNLNMLNCTVADNMTTSSTAILGSGVLFSQSSNIDCINSIFWNSNQGLEIQPASGTTGIANISYSDIRGGYIGIGNIDTFPNFVSLFDFHLIPSSPCINAGTLTSAPLFDLDNLPRPAPAGTNPDMGCYELSQPVSINEFDENNILLKVFPNPSNSNFQIIFKNTIIKGKVTVLNNIGENIYEENINYESKKVINNLNIASGIYYVLVNDGERSSYCKLIVEYD